jgi:hypothetical protein
MMMRMAGHPAGINERCKLSAVIIEQNLQTDRNTLAAASVSVLVIAGMDNCFAPAESACCPKARSAAKASETE